MHAAVAERPKVADAPLSVVLLAPIGGQDVDAVVRSWLEWLNQRASEAEVLLVLDSSPNFNPPIDDARLRIVHHVAPAGFGACLQTAVWLVRHPLMLTATADHQFQPLDAKRLFEHIDQTDLVSGFRVPGPPPLWLRILGIAKRLLTRFLLGYVDAPRAAWLGWAGLGRRIWLRLIFGVKLHDALCVLRLYRTEVLRRFPIQSRGTFALVEVLAKANHLGCWMADAPAPWTPSAADEPDPYWKSDEETLLKRPDFGDPVLPRSSELRAGVGASDLIA